VVAVWGDITARRPQAKQKLELEREIGGQGEGNKDEVDETFLTLLSSSISSSSSRAKEAATS